MSINLKNEINEFSNLIFSVRPRSLDVKEWLPWNYADNICIACKRCEETMKYFMVLSHTKTKHVLIKKRFLMTS